MDWLEQLKARFAGKPEEEDPFEAAKQRNLDRLEKRNQLVRDQIQRQLYGVQVPPKVAPEAESHINLPQLLNKPLPSATPGYIEESDKEYDKAVQGERDKEMVLNKERFRKLMQGLGGGDGQ